MAMLVGGGDGEVIVDVDEEEESQSPLVWFSNTSQSLANQAHSLSLTSRRRSLVRHQSSPRGGGFQVVPPESVTTTGLFDPFNRGLSCFDAAVPAAAAAFFSTAVW